MSAETIGVDERVDHDFEATEAIRRRELWDDTLHDRCRDRDAQREALSLGQRLDRACAQLATMSTQPARAIGRRVKSAEPDDVGPTGGEQVNIDRHLRAILHHVRQIEDTVDAERGLVVRAWATMHEEDKDRVLWDEFEGVPAAQVARSAPYLGASRLTIIRARLREAARRGVTCDPNTGAIVDRATSR